MNLVKEAIHLGFSNAAGHGYKETGFCAGISNLL